MQTMDSLCNLCWLLYLGFSVAFHEINADTFTNEQTSFLQLEKWDVSESRGLGFRFKTFLSDALLLYMDDGGKSNFLRVELFQGKLRLTCSHGSRFGAMAVEIGDNLNDLLWHRVLLERDKGETTISLESQSKSSVKSRDGEKTSLSIESSIFFGGIPPRLAANDITQPSVLLLHRFLGCITDIEMFEYSTWQGKRRKPIVEELNGVVSGCTDMCKIDNKCQNNGTCLNRFTASECDCNVTGFRGKTCEEALPVLGFRRSDYVIFKRSNKSIASQHDRIIFRFKTASQNGSLLESGLGRDYLVIELFRGFLLVRWNLGSGEIYLHVREKACGDGKWHSVDITRNQRQLDLTLDGTLHVSRTFPGRFISFNLRQGEGDVFIGGMLRSASFKSRSSWMSFDGCLQEINFNGVDIVQGVVSGDGAFKTKGRPRSRCEISTDVGPTTVTLASTSPLVSTYQTTTEQSTTSVSRTDEVQLSFSYTTTPMTTSKDFTYSSQRAPTSHAQSFVRNSVTPCSDDEDDCDSDDSGSGDDEESSSANRQSSGDKSTSSSNAKENNGKITTNKSVKKPLKPLPTKDPFETEDELVGETDISRPNCIGDDEDGCDNDGDSGQSSTETGSGKSASPTTTSKPVSEGDKFVRKTIRVKTDSRKKWALIAGIIVVGTLLVAFCIFAVWWLCKHKDEYHWSRTHKGSREKCLQAEVTDV